MLSDFRVQEIEFKAWIERTLSFSHSKVAQAQGGNQGVRSFDNWSYDRNEGKTDINVFTLTSDPGGPGGPTGP